MASNRASWLEWRGIISTLLFLSTITSRHRAQSYSNHINIDEFDNDNGFVSTTPYMQEAITSPSISFMRDLLTTIKLSSLPPADSSISTIPSKSNADVEFLHHFTFSHPIYNATIPENSVVKTFVVQPYTDKARMGISLTGAGVHNIDVKYQIVNNDKIKVIKTKFWIRER